ncbi:putative sporulation protein YtxC [Neobacillus mesonae]|uniref:putative sporulation protein YtxC n=1 Tax=Neobacillus mesonae TaxID=1193713 RepID=UPI00203FA266|nr:putative sporulation protein YtxC [Neobacillus mesonae]MCM3568326.1 putative sporulation protein YtxC [Neobacillus mesonae]
MVEIIFQNRLDAIRFYNHLKKWLNRDPDYEKNILLIEDRHIVKIENDYFSINHILEKVKHAFYEFITNIKRDDWLQDILKNKYYFEDVEEQQQILDILYSVLDGQREDLAVFLKETNLEPMINEAISHVIHENVSFSFDSFLKFRLRSYLQLLENYVEISIDEYKMEQEYQMFVHMLREFLTGREPKMNLLHLLLDDDIVFYDEKYVEIKRSELAKMIDRKLLVNHPVYIDSASIAPLLSLAPTKIFLYTKNADAPLVRTIKNIFEERVIIKSYQALRKLKGEEFGDSAIEGKA